MLGTSCIAQAHDSSCKFSTDFDIDINESSIVFEKEPGDKLEFKGESLFINGNEVELTDEQIKASESLQDGARKLVPKIAKIAVEGAELGIKASTLVITAMFGEDQDVHNDLIAPIEKISEKVQANINDKHMNTKELEQAFENAFDEDFEQLIETAATKYSGKIVGNVLSAIFSGDEEEIKDFEFRMENMERDIEKYVEQNAKDIEQQAEALCVDFAALEKLDQTLESISGYPENGVIQTNGNGINVSGFSWGE